MAKAFQAASSPFAQIAKGVRSNLVKSRVDIVSPQLCDDALARLAPSLQNYKGCTIIDVNPGIGLWSSKIHDIVKPRQHILAEPPESPFAQHLKQYTDQSSSRYKLIDWPQLESWEPDRYVAEGLLPALDVQKSTEPNRSILFLANTAYSAHRSMTSSIARTQIKLLCWASDILNGATFHAGGPVRMLLWCPEKDVATVLPRTIRQRSKFALLMEMTCKVEEIVGCDESTLRKQKMRDQVIELESGKRVAKLMADSGVSTPSGRETNLQKQVREADERSKGKGAGENLGATGTRARNWHEELEELREKFKDAPKDSKGRYIHLNQPKEIIEDPQYLRFIDLERNFRHQQKKTVEIKELLQEQAEIDALDLRAHDPKLKDAQRNAALAKLQRKKDQLQAHLDNTKGRLTRNEFKFFKDDRKAFASNPPLLMWDQRTAEPLKAYKEEFYPAKNLCLLDIQPRYPLPYPMTPAQLLFLRMLTTTIWQGGADNLTILDRIAPGAFNALTSKVPSLTDPTRGGERDIRDLTIDRLTPEMAYGLVKAWFDWPFRPNLGDLIHRGNLIDDLDSDDGGIPGGR
ncbi:MAG: hypothetical protein Q9205_003659 [Flavoplaca limonia]